MALKKFEDYEFKNPAKAKQFYEAEIINAKKEGEENPESAALLLTTFVCPQTSGSRKKNYAGK